jgi:hypothetical protein
VDNPSLDARGRRRERGCDKTKGGEEGEQGGGKKFDLH